MNNTENPIYVKRLGPHKWKTTRKWTSPNGVDVPKDFVTDGASIPRFLWFFATPAGVMFEAALLHDYRYTYQNCTRKDADEEFLDNLKNYKVNTTLANLAWAAVRLFGRYY